MIAMNVPGGRPAPLRRFLAGAGMAALVAVCLAGCFEQTPSRPLGKPFPSPTPETVFRKDPCSLLTKAEVEKAVGNALAPAVVSSHPGAGHNCLWAPTGPGGWIVGLDASTPATMAAQGLKGTPASLYDSQVTAAGQDVSGLGDRARWVPEVNRLMVLRGQLLLQLVFLKPGGRFEAARAEELARLALSRA